MNQVKTTALRSIAPRVVPLHTMTPQNKLSSVAKATPSVIALAIRHPVIQEYIWMVTILTSIMLLVM